MTPASKLALALLVVHLVGVATAAPSAAGNDEVLQLPNLNRKPCWRSFSGYLPVAGQACLLNSLMPGAQLASAGGPVPRRHFELAAACFGHSVARVSRVLRLFWQAGNSFFTGTTRPRSPPHPPDMAMSSFGSLLTGVTLACHHRSLAVPPHSVRACTYK